MKINKNFYTAKGKFNFRVLLLFLLLASAFLFFSSHPSSNVLAAGTYQNQEKIPGASGQTSDFIVYMKQIIGFGYATIGILAMFMLSVGAYQYLMAAGNLAKAESAKNTISSALLGLVLGLMSWVILYTINPDLVSMRGINLSGLQINSPGGSAAPSGETTPAPNAGLCVDGTGACSASNLSCFGAQAQNASIVCNAESGGRTNIGSSTDKCGGQSASWGAMQINITCHNIGGYSCTSAVSCCYDGKSCNSSNCQVTDSATYNNCIAAASDPMTNINAACGIYNQSGWSPWGAAKKCGVTG